MKANRFTYALTAAGLLAVLGVYALLRTAVGVDTLIGYGAAVALLGLVAVDYRVARRALGR